MVERESVVSQGRIQVLLPLSCWNWPRFAKHSEARRESPPSTSPIRGTDNRDRHHRVAGGIDDLSVTDTESSWLVSDPHVVARCHLIQTTLRALARNQLRLKFQRPAPRWSDATELHNFHKEAATVPAPGAPPATTHRRSGLRPPTVTIERFHQVACRRLGVHTARRPRIGPARVACLAAQLQPPRARNRVRSRPARRRLTDLSGQS